METKMETTKSCVIAFLVTVLIFLSGSLGMKNIIIEELREKVQYYMCKDSDNTQYMYECREEN